MFVFDRRGRGNRRLGLGRCENSPERRRLQACQAASAAQLEEGDVGVGAGATVGKCLEEGYNGMKSASLRRASAWDMIIGALVVANSVATSWTAPPKNRLPGAPP